MGPSSSGFDTFACSTHSTNYEIKLNYENNFTQYSCGACVLCDDYYFVFFLTAILREEKIISS
jgi:hypothetical protein